MARLLIRNLDDGTMARLQRRARRHGRGVEAEVRAILRDVVKIESASRLPLGSRLAARFARIGLTADIPDLRGQILRPADFGS